MLTAANGDKVVVSGHPGERGTFDLFFTAIGRTDLLTNPKFIDVPSRLVNLEELQSILRAWALTIPDATAIEEALAKHKLASGKIRTTREFADTDWAAAREITVEVSNRGGGKVRIPNAPWKFSDATVTTAGSPKYRGEDNALVLGDLLGLSTTEVDALTESGVLQRRVPPGATP